jgi:hypothetical protein
VVTNALTTADSLPFVDAGIALAKAAAGRLDEARSELTAAAQD